MDRDEVGLIAVGRALISDPLRVSKVREGDSTSLKALEPASLSELVRGSPNLAPPTGDRRATTSDRPPPDDGLTA